MKRLLHLLTNCITVGAMLVVLFGAWPHGAYKVEGAYSAGCMSCRLGSGGLSPVTSPDGLFHLRSAGLDFTFDVTARMPEDALGLPGEPITWVISLANTSAITGTDVIITDKLRDELQIDSVDVADGEVAVSEQMIVFTLPEIKPGQTALVTINTTVLRCPIDGLLQNQAVMVASGPHGEISRVAETEVYVPSGLPATGYAPRARTGEHSSESLAVMMLLAMGVVSTTAFYVYRRGRRV